MKELAKMPASARGVQQMPQGEEKEEETKKDL